MKHENLNLSITKLNHNFSKTKIKRFLKDNECYEVPEMFVYMFWENIAPIEHISLPDSIEELISISNDYFIKESAGFGVLF